MVFEGFRAPLKGFVKDHYRRVLSPIRLPYHPH